MRFQVVNLIRPLSQVDLTGPPNLSLWGPLKADPRQGLRWKSYLRGDARKHERKCGNEARQGHKQRKDAWWTGYHCGIEFHWDPLRCSGECAPELSTKEQGRLRVNRQIPAFIVWGSPGVFPAQWAVRWGAETDSGGRRLPCWEAAGKLRDESNIMVGQQQDGHILSSLLFV